ncbi:hypothetical protein DL98DRAFT_435993 [Cadophora sp. DSE1049]|nr:hypothetical protein DL98DRAFT_435993 [Cadophora sp. DSE1049]
MILGGWRSYITGALTLLKARRAARCATAYGRELVVAVKEQVIPLSIATGLHLDSKFDWMELEVDETGKVFTKLNLAMVDVQADNKTITSLLERSTDNMEKVINLLRRAEALEQRYADWLRCLPASWQIQSAGWSDFDAANLSTSLVYPGRVDKFGGLWMVNKYNVARSCRILLWSTILRCIAWLGGPEEYVMSAEYSNGSRKCRQLIEDITASVLFYFGWDSETSAAMANRFEHNAEILLTAKGRAGIFLLWPLYVAASSDFSLPSERVYLRGKLKFIAENLRVNQAVIALRVSVSETFEISLETML